jgi:acyl-[acyl-carrier-protein]-phospholipid O-acyltransferase/long-chain-fatty-acid--[acyl-carrier-protein] ligase
VIGWILCRGVTRVPAASPHCRLQINPIRDFLREMKAMKPDRELYRANWCNALFFFIATLVQMNLLIYAKDVLHLSDAQNGLINASLAIGVGVGCAVAGMASRGKIEYELVPLGAVGLALSTIPMGWPHIGIVGFNLALFALGLSGGFFILPVGAILQHRPAPENIGAVQGASCLLCFIVIVGASGVQVLLNQALRLTPGQMFWACGVFAVLLGMYAHLTRPDALRQFLTGESEAEAPEIETEPGVSEGTETPF